MKLILKITGIIVALLIIAVISLAVVAHFVITPERVRARVIPMAENALNRKVNLKNIKISIFSGITLTGFSIAEADGKTPFVSADAAVLKYRLMPLLHGKIEVDEIGLFRPKVRVVRNPDGTFNFSDLIPSVKKGKNKSAKKSKSSGKRGESPFALLISKAAISGGDIDFIDHAAPGKTPFSLHITGLDLQARDISLNKAFPFTFRADVNGKRLSAAGSVDPAKSAFDAKIGISGFPVTDFEAYFKKALPGRLYSAALSVDIKVAADSKKVLSSGVIGLKNVDLTLDAMPDARLKNAHLSLDYNVAVDLKASAVTIKKASVDLNGIKINAKGLVSRYDKTPVLDMGVILPVIRLSDVLGAMPAGIFAKVKDLNLKGEVGAKARIAGPVSSPEKLLDTALISLDKVSAKVGGLEPVVTGKINVAGESVDTKGLMIALGKDKVLLDLAVKNLMARPMRVKSVITSAHIDVDALMSAMGKSTPSTARTKALEKEPVVIKKSHEIGPFDIPVTANVKVNIASAVYKRLNISGIRLLCRLEKNIFYLKEFSAGVAGGTVAANGRVDLSRKGLGYFVNLKAAGVRAEPIVAALFPSASGTVFGTVDLTTDIMGSGTNLNAIRKNLSSNAQIKIADGRVTGQGLVRGLADFFNTEKLKIIDFKKFTGNVKIAGGKAMIDSDFSGHDVRMMPRGQIGLDGSLNLALDLRLAPDLSKKIDKHGSVTKFLSDDSGWTMIPLKLAGTFSSPRFSLNAAAVTRQIRQKAVEIMEEKIQKKLFKKFMPKAKKGGSKNGSEAGQAEDAAGKLINNALKGLFGK